jgi:hypothetical protein
VWQVLQALQDNGLVIHVEKYVWGVPELDYLDHQISTAAVLQLHSHVKAIHEFPRPSTVKELHSILGGQLLQQVSTWSGRHPLPPHGATWLQEGVGARGVACSHG